MKKHLRSFDYVVQFKDYNGRWMRSGRVPQDKDMTLKQAKHHARQSSKVFQYLHYRVVAIYPAHTRVVYTVRGMFA